MTAGDEDMVETLEVLSDDGLVRDILAGLAELARGDVFTLDEVEAALRSCGRLP